MIKNGIMQAKGCTREANNTRPRPIEDVEPKTVERKIMAAEKPSRKSRTHQENPKYKAAMTPTKLKKIQNTQVKSERPVVLRKS